MTCPGCGCVFCPDMVPESDGNPRVYCTASCQSAAKVRRYKASRRARKRAQRAGVLLTDKHFCAACGKVFHKRQGGLKRWCSKTCERFVQSHSGLAPRELAAEWARATAPEVPDEPRACPSGKIRHEDEADAQASLKMVVRQRYAGYQDWLRVYRCEQCDGWHLTSKPRRRSKVSR